MTARSSLLIASLLLIAACDHDIALAPASDGGVTGDAANWVVVETDQNLKNKVDILFMIDDSGSMQPKQKALRDRFPQLMEQLDTFAVQGHPASYHLGVVTSDLGAPGINCPYNLGGKLQAVGAAAAAGCQGPTSGTRYLVYDQLDPTNNNNPTGQTPAQTFACMAQVTSDDNSHVGCGFESQLESVYKALHDPVAENVGFLRADAILLVVWLTDEDDCSADPTTDLFSDMTDYGNQASFKCTRYGISCDGQFPLPATAQQSFGSCVPATPAQGSKLIDVNKYITFFTKPASVGGVKANPADVVLAAIDAPTTPFGTSGSTDQAQCGVGVASCTILDHSCLAADNAAFFGDPAVRMNAVINSAQNNFVTSICDTDYSSVLTGIGNKIVSTLQPTCLSVPVFNPTSPNCVVQDVTTIGGVVVTLAIPLCDVTHSVVPCWAPTTPTQCPPVCNPVSGQLQQFGVAIDRGKDSTGAANPAPANTVASVSCQIVPAGTPGTCN